MMCRAVRSSSRNFWLASGSDSLSGMGCSKTYLTLLSKKTASSSRLQKEKLVPLGSRRHLDLSSGSSISESETEKSAIIFASQRIAEKQHSSNVQLLVTKQRYLMLLFFFFLRFFSFLFIKYLILINLIILIF